MYTGTLDAKVQEMLEGICDKGGYEKTVPNFVEIIQEGDEISIETLEYHRWYDEVEIVVQIDNRFLRYNWYHITGDASVSDMGLEFDLSSVKFCEPYQVMVTKYRPIK